MAVKASQKVGRSSDGSLLRVLLGSLHEALRAEVTAGEVLALLRALEDAEVRYWLVGGWGVDALVGHQTRRHHDLDLVVDDFERCCTDAKAVLGKLGFNISRELHSATWMPDRWQVQDEELRVVDLLSIGWAKTAAALQQSQGASGEAVTALAELRALDREALRRVAFTEGTVAGQRVPCLSAAVQMLYHSGFEPSLAQLHDIALLREILRTSSGPVPGGSSGHGPPVEGEGLEDVPSSSLRAVGHEQDFAGHGVDW